VKSNIALHGRDDVQCAGSYLNSSKGKTMLNRSILAYTLAPLGLLCQSSDAADPSGFKLYHSNNEPWRGEEVSLSPEPIGHCLKRKCDDMQTLVKWLRALVEHASEQHDMWYKTLETLSKRVKPEVHADVVAACSALEVIHTDCRRNYTPVLQVIAGQMQQWPQVVPDVKAIELAGKVTGWVLTERCKREMIVRSQVDRVAQSMQAKIRTPNGTVKLTVGWLVQFEATMTEVQRGWDNTLG
jgi:hypothetical protein